MTAQNTPRIIFMGTPDFSVAPLMALCEAGLKPVCVYTQPPRPAGRGYEVQKSAVHRAAETLGIEVRTPENFKNEDDRTAFLELKADYAVVVAYGLILPRAILNGVTKECLNIHASLLPRWRGAAPIQRAIEAGDRETGICIMRMEEGLDTGPVMLRKTIPITNTTTGKSLHDDLAALGAEAITEAMHILENVPAHFEPQDDALATYAKKLHKQEAQIDWAQDATALERKIRAFTPWPGTWCFVHPGQTRLKIIEARLMPLDKPQPAGKILDNRLTVACGKDALRLLTVQAEGRKPTDGESFLNGSPLNAGHHIENGEQL